MSMKKLVAKAMLLSMAVVAFLASSNTAVAKVYGYDFTEENFPAADYANRYADVKDAFGDDTTAIYNHYKLNVIISLILTTTTINTRFSNLSAFHYENNRKTLKIIPNNFVKRIIPIFFTDSLTKTNWSF